MANFNGVITIKGTWTSLKTVASNKNLNIQYDESSTAYDIFCLDSGVVYQTIIFKGNVPDNINFNQATNDADLLDFETNYKDIVTNNSIQNQLKIEGIGLDGNVVSVNPILIAGQDGTNLQSILTDSTGKLIILGSGTAGTPATGVLTIQGISSGTPITVDGSAVTQPVSNAGLSNIDVLLSTRLKPADTLNAVTTLGTITNPLPAGTNLLGTIGIDQTTPGTTNKVNIGSDGVVGLASGSNVIGSLSSNQSVNISQINGVTTSVGNGISGTGVQRVTIASDSTGTVFATQTGTWNINNISGTVSLPTGAATSLLQTDGNSSLSNIDTKTPALGQTTMAGSTPVTIASNQTALPITDNAGSLTIDNPTLSITGGGVESSALRVTIATDSTGVLSIDDNGGSLTVDGTVTANAGTGNFTVTQATGTNLHVVVDSAPTTTVTGTIAATQSGTWNVRTQDGSGNALASSTTTPAGTEQALIVRNIPSGTQTVSGTVTANIGTSGSLALDTSISTLNTSVNTLLKPANTLSAVTTVSTVTNLSQMSGAAISMGTGTRDAGTQRVTIATNDLVPVSDNSGSLTVDAPVGTPVFVRLSDGASAISALPITDNSGSLTIDNPALSVTGGGVESGALRVTIANDSTGVLSIDDNGGSITVDGTIAATQSGTWTVQPGNTANTTPWLTTIAQGGNSAVVKAASTAPTTTDPALVVTLSPNHAIDSITTGTLTALNQTVQIATAGKYTVGGNITGTWVGTISSEGSVDGGATWFAIRTANKSSNNIVFSYTANDNFEFYSHGGCTHVRLIASAWTSGTASIALAGTSTAQDALLNYSGTDGDVSPPLRHLSIGLQDQAGVQRLPKVSNVTPVGDEYGIITRNVTNQYSTFGPDPSGYIVGASNLQVDTTNSLMVRGAVLSDELSFRDDFTGSSITTALTGTLTFTNGSNIVTGSGTLFTSEVKQGQYIKKTADSETLYVDIDTIDSDTSLTLTSNYAGTTSSTTGVSSNWKTTTPGGGSITVGTSLVTISIGTANAATGGIFKSGDYPPYTLQIAGTITNRRANQTLNLGFCDSPTSISKGAYVQFTGTTTTTATFITQSSSAAADTQTSTFTFPIGNSSTQHTYKIDLSTNQASLLIDDIPVVVHKTHIPGPYDVLGFMAWVTNTGITAGTTTFTLDYFYFANWDRLQIDNDFSSEPIKIQNFTFQPITYSAGIVGLVPPTTPTDIFTLTGSATKTVKITNLILSGTRTTATHTDILLLKRNTANSGGTSTTPTAVSYDSLDTAATAVVRAYTVNPTTGALVGNIKVQKVFIPTTTATGYSLFEYKFVPGYNKPITLRGTNEVLALNLNSTTVAGNNFDITIEWTEE